LKDADAQNSFGICLEWRIGVQSNLALAALYYQRSALQGHPDGANNLGCCREHGRGVEQDIQLAAQFYKSAADRGHPKGCLNYRRCLYLRGRWNPPSRSSQVSVCPPSNDRLAGLFIDCVKESEALDGASAELIASIERLGTSLSTEVILRMQTAEWGAKSELRCSDSSLVRLAHSPEVTLSAVTFVETPRGAQLIQQESRISRSFPWMDRPEYNNCH
jgi:TPR repeat protein